MKQATRFTAEGDEIAVRYVANSGSRELALTINGQDREFSDWEISVEDTMIGSLVVVTTDALLDAREGRVAIIVPPVNLQAGDRAVPIRLIVMEVTRWTSFTGAQGVTGPLYTYYPHELDGVASADDD